MNTSIKAILLGMQIRGKYVTEKEKAEILKKVKQREYEKRCVNVRICPICGQDLVCMCEGESASDRTCRACNLCWDYVQNGF
ncbi:hypothetical protein LCGC14_0805830 [marine sediment metagenome]|uniref:Uncharacterized protein n=1 Tax=marine sediment metagenome TaxID=412755 RepID=A0A0F9PSS4_9ZZZZ